MSPNSWLKIDAASPRPKTPILWLDVSIALPVRVLPFGIGTFTPPQYHLFGDASGGLSSPLDETFQGVLLTY
ncbi:hypothetical protein MYAER_1204 [Microcystis aeruginosa NIES-2549]|uniref:Uncharacterized protein n=1 Tax=Microcystis aeruginosa NIES-2549 TaxID=1641812 RepID=A0A0F6U2U9_MICAE|nr:hypothetical protein MYAER_1204 [Microcystis aeruginosa NIES-2549]AOC51959.1 hypothetical protein amyaer_1222 [Microcystis aeruginosa NIES-2481]